MEIDPNRLAETYLRSRHQRDEDIWAWETVNDAVRSGNFNRAYEITLLLLKKATTDDELKYVAAGPLEDLVDGYGNRALDRLEQVCDEDSRLQFALSGIWLLPDSAVLQRWQALMIKYGFASGNRKPLSRHPDCWPDSWPEY
jgi:hypothetical protein